MHNTLYSHTTLHTTHYNLYEHTIIIHHYDNDHACMHMHTATSSEEISFLKDKLDSIYQELDRDHENGGSTSILISSVKEKVKACLGQSDIALNKLRAEKQDLLDRVDALTKENEEIRKELERQGTTGRESIANHCLLPNIITLATDTKKDSSKVAHKDTTSNSDGI